MTSSPGTNAITGWRNPALEDAILADLAITEPWSIVEQFSEITRSSGSVEERGAFDILTTKLTEFGVPFTLHEPECFISWPLSASVRAVGEGGQTFFAKTSAMSVSTDGQEIEGELVYVPPTKLDAQDAVHTVLSLEGRDVRGKIVLVDGLPLSNNATAVAQSGALAGIFISPGQRIHESICTSIWGTPDLDSIKRLPQVPMAAVNNTDGQTLIELAKQGGRVAVSTTLETRWRTIPILVAEIKSDVLPNEFVLLNGHLDSWHGGVGDNATGNAAMLEIARVFSQHRSSLARSLRIAWWSGHSHGRYAGSTWYSDTFAIDLAANCVAQVNCDSPGCRWTETFNSLSCMSEAAPMIEETIERITGIVPETERPPRAGDYAFNSIGISSFLMLSSTMSNELRAEKGYYPVGGCGGNIAWHTEDDTLEIADPDYLLRDIRVYAGALLAALNAPLHPYDWRRTTAEIRSTLSGYQAAIDGDFDFSPAFTALDNLDQALDKLYTTSATEVTSPDAIRFNLAQRQLGRTLIPVNYSRMAPFWHDPALKIAPLPDLVPVLTAKRARQSHDTLRILQTHLTRGQNRLVWALMQAQEIAERGNAG
jgi:hypothetical protein